MNLNFDFTDSEKKDIAERVRESPQIWDAIQEWAYARLKGGGMTTDLILLDKLELETLHYIKNPKEKEESEGLDEDGPWEAA